MTKLPPASHLCFLITNNDCSGRLWR
jgi:hypothetical protein